MEEKLKLCWDMAYRIVQQRDAGKMTNYRESEMECMAYNLWLRLMEGREKMVYIYTTEEVHRV